MMLALVLWLAAPVWSDVVARIDSGAVTSNPEMLRGAIADCDTLASDTAASARTRELARYGAAYAAWRLAFLPGVDTTETAKRLGAAELNLRGVIAAHPESAEAHALLAAVLGSIIRAGGDAMRYGPDSQHEVETALRLEPNNPRVRLEEGLNAFHTPAEYGGGLANAEAALRQAIALLEREPPDRPWPSWGGFDAHVWLGQVLAARGDKAAARKEYERALTFWPQSGWVKQVLLPALDR